MYPWHESLSSWAEATGLRIDALGLVTFLGADEMNRSIGRLMPSKYLNHLPLLGAFTIANNHFTEKTPGYTLYNISAGIMTTELAGWFSRWLRAQDFKQVRSRVTWEVVEKDRRWQAYFVQSFLVGLPLHGMLIALTVLAEDWWGFANAAAMIVSVIVRCVQIAQNQAGIDATIRETAAEERQKYEKAKEEFESRRQRGEVNDEVKPPVHPKDEEAVKVILLMEDSKVVTIRAPGSLIRPVFTASPIIPRPGVYLACRVVGWVAFAVHVISIGMAALYTQIFSVVLIIVATVLTAYKVGCDDSQLAWPRHGRSEDDRWDCRVTSTLEATVETYPAEYTQWDPLPEDGTKYETTPKMNVTTEKGALWPGQPWPRASTVGDVEQAAPVQKSPVLRVPERRRDLYVWLQLTLEEERRLVAWGLMPLSQAWMDDYREKKEIHRLRISESPAR